MIGWSLSPFVILSKQGSSLPTLIYKCQVTAMQTKGVHMLEIGPSADCQEEMISGKLNHVITVSKFTELKQVMIFILHTPTHRKGRRCLF